MAGTHTKGKGSRTHAHMHTPTAAPHRVELASLNRIKQKRCIGHKQELVFGTMRTMRTIENGARRINESKVISYGEREDLFSQGSATDKQMIFLLNKPQGYDKNNIRIQFGIKLRGTVSPTLPVEQIVFSHLQLPRFQI